MELQVYKGPEMLSSLIPHSVQDTLFLYIQLLDGDSLKLLLYGFKLRLC